MTGNCSIVEAAMHYNADCIDEHYLSTSKFAIDDTTCANTSQNNFIYSYRLTCTEAAPLPTVTFDGVQQRSFMGDADCESLAKVVEYTTLATDVCFTGHYIGNANSTMYNCSDDDTTAPSITTKVFVGNANCDTEDARVVVTSSEVSDVCTVQDIKDPFVDDDYFPLFPTNNRRLHNGEDHLEYFYNEHAFQGSVSTVCVKDGDSYTFEPTPEPTLEPTFEPTFEPTMDPSFAPTAEPTADPSFTADPSMSPTTRTPTIRPTAIPSLSRSPSNTRSPTISFNPSTIRPSRNPTISFSPSVSFNPTTIRPSRSPSWSSAPAQVPSVTPSQSGAPSFMPASTAVTILSVSQPLVGLDATAYNADVTTNSAALKQSIAQCLEGIITADDILSLVVKASTTSAAIASFRQQLHRERVHVTATTSSTATYDIYVAYVQPNASATSISTTLSTQLANGAFNTYLASNSITYGATALTGVTSSSATIVDISPSDASDGGDADTFSTGAIIGVAVGGLVAVIVLFLLVCRFCSSGKPAASGRGGGAGKRGYRFASTGGDSMHFDDDIFEEGVGTNNASGKNVEVGNFAIFTGSSSHHNSIATTPTVPQRDSNAHTSPKRPPQFTYDPAANRASDGAVTTVGQEARLGVEDEYAGGYRAAKSRQNSNRGTTTTATMGKGLLPPPPPAGKTLRQQQQLQQSKPADPWATTNEDWQL